MAYIISAFPYLPCPIHALSNSLFSFSAGCAIEQYRAHKETNPELAEKFAAHAEELLLKVPTFMGKKRFMAQSLPLETFADRKIKKWQARATAKGVRLVDGAGVSPIEEMIYVWSKSLIPPPHGGSCDGNTLG